MRREQLGRLVSQVDDRGRLDLPLLGVSVATGVRERTEGDGRPAPSLDLSGYKVVAANDIIMNALGKPHGSIGRASSPGITSPAYWVLRTNSALDPGFAHHLFRSHWMVKRLAGLGKNLPPNQFDISWEVFKRIEILLPSMDEQQRIATFLDGRVARIDRIIEARRQQVSLLEERLTADIRRGVAGLYTHEARSVPSPIGWLGSMADYCVPVPLSRVLVLQRGVDLTEDERVPGDAKVVTTAGVVGTHNVAVEQGPGIVIGRYGSVGNVHWVDGPYWPHNTTLYVKGTSGNHKEWIYFLLRSFPYAAMQARAAIPGVNRNDMASEMVPLLPAHRQREAADWLQSRVDRQASLTVDLTHSIDLLSEYKTSLITAAVTGELDVTTAGSGIPA